MKKIIGLITTLSLCLGAQSAQAQVVPLPPDTSTKVTLQGPDDAVVCTVTAFEPYKAILWSGMYQMTGPGRIECTPHAPTESRLSVQIQRYNGRTFINIGSPTTYDYPTTYKTIWDTYKPCPNGTYMYRVWAHWYGYYGNPAHADDWSVGKTITCPPY